PCRLPAPSIGRPANLLKLPEILCSWARGHKACPESERGAAAFPYAWPGKSCVDLSAVPSPGAGNEAVDDLPAANALRAKRFPQLHRLRLLGYSPRWCVRYDWVLYPGPTSPPQRSEEILRPPGWVVPAIE